MTSFAEGQNFAFKVEEYIHNSHLQSKLFSIFISVLEDSKMFVQKLDEQMVFH